MYVRISTYMQLNSEYLCYLPSVTSPKRPKFLLSAHIPNEKVNSLRFAQGTLHLQIAQLN